MFRFKKSVKRSYAEQGYIYYISKMYDDLPRRGKETIWRAAFKAGGEPYLFALFEYVTTYTSPEKICSKYYMSRGTLQRCVKRYFEIFPVRFR